MNAIDFFVNHGKPAVSSSIKVDERLWAFPFLYIYRRKCDSPYYSEVETNDNLLGYDFFKTVEDKEVALELGYGMKKSERGLMYGFPPTAIKNFEFQCKLKTFEGLNSMERLIIDYYGLSFICFETDFGQVCEELYEMYRLSPSKIRATRFNLKKSGFLTD